MWCPKCKYNKKAICIDSRPHKDGSTSRRYKCVSRRCGWRWSTTEIIVSQGKGPRKPGRVFPGTMTLHKYRDRQALVGELKRLVAEMQ